MVKAKRLRVFDAQKFRQCCIVAQTGVLIQRKVNRIQGNIVVQQKLNTIAVRPLNGKLGTPKKAMVYKKHIAANFCALPKAFHAGIHGKNYFFNFTAVVIYLNTIQGVIDTAKTFDVERRSKKFIQRRCVTQTNTALWLEYRLYIRNMPDPPAFKISVVVQGSFYKGNFIRDRIIRNVIQN